jgi:arginase
MLQNKGVAIEWSKIPGSVRPQTSAPDLGSQDRNEMVVAAVKQHCERIEYACTLGMHPVALGGDHSMATGTISGLANAKKAHGALGLIWIDAHLDAHTPDTSPSRAIHGMPVAQLLGYGDKAFVNLGHSTPVIRPEHLVMIGARSWEEEEHRFLKQQGVRIYYIEDVRERGIAPVMQEACALINVGTKAQALSLDVDVLDPEESPGFGSHEPGGLGMEGVLAGLRWLSAHQHFDSFEFVEYNPDRDDQQASTARFIEKALEIVL